MIVTLPVEKVDAIIAECCCLMKKSRISIRHVARVIRLLVSTFSAVEFGPLHYRDLELQKINSLKSACDNFDVDMNIIDHRDPDVIITTDASTLGWGAVCNNSKIQGHWNGIERTNHINV